MNKADFIEAVAKETGLSKKDTEKAYKAFTNVIWAQLKKKDEVPLEGFVEFETSK